LDIKLTRVCVGKWIVPLKEEVALPVQRESASPSGKGNPIKSAKFLVELSAAQITFLQHL